MEYLLGGLLLLFQFVSVRRNKSHLTGNLSKLLPLLSMNQDKSLFDFQRFTVNNVGALKAI